MNRSAHLPATLDRPRSGRSVIRGALSESATPDPTVSVVIPCYNYGHFLAECVTSVVQQQGVDVEVLIIDDASTDGSGEIADRIAARHDRVRTIRHARNRGHIATYNEGLDEITGQYVVLLDADDVLTPGALGRATALMNAHPEVGLVYGHPRIFSGDTPPAAGHLRSWTVWPGADWVAMQCRRGRSVICSPEVVMRTSTQRAAGRLREELPHAGDLDIWLRIAARSQVGRVNGPDQALRRLHGQSMIATSYASHIADLRGRLDAYESFVARDAPADQRDRWADLARRSTAGEAVEGACVLVQRSAGDEVVQEHLDFARSLWPGVVRTRTWREVEFRRRGGHGPRLRWYDLRRALEGKLTWQRWHRTGT